MAGITVVLSRQGVPARWAYAIHHGVVCPFVGELEVHPVAPETRYTQNVPTLGAAIGRSWIRRG
jgi:hypothetical protein